MPAWYVGENASTSHELMSTPQNTTRSKNDIPSPLK